MTVVPTTLTKCAHLWRTVQLTLISIELFPGFTVVTMVSKDLPLFSVRLTCRVEPVMCARSKRTVDQFGAPHELLYITNLPLVLPVVATSQPRSNICQRIDAMPGTRMRHPIGIFCLVSALALFGTPIQATSDAVVYTKAASMDQVMSLPGLPNQLKSKLFSVR